MLSRWIALSGLLLGGCAYDAGYHQSNYASQPNSVAGYYSAVDYNNPYQPGSPVWGSPYVSGPVAGSIYSYGDDRDIYGGPVFSPYHGIQCDRRRNLCWNRHRPDYDWSYRFFGNRHAQWYGDDHDGDWHHGHGNGHGGQQGGDWGQGNWHNGGGGHGGNPGGPNHGGGNPKAWVYQVPLEPDGKGTPTFLPNGCGANGQPPC